MTKGERTRREIVEKAAPLFNQKGYEGTSLSDLMEATGLKKAESTTIFRARRRWPPRRSTMRRGRQPRAG
jgi:TetR/AcrR family transcriptional repressor of nem operon